MTEIQVYEQTCDDMDMLEIRYKKIRDCFAKYDKQVQGSIIITLCIEK